MTITGNLTRDPELRYTQSGVAVATFSVAATPRYMDQQTQEWKDGTTLFLNCTVWRQQAENVAETLVKGMRVIVHGKLGQRSYDTQQGEKRTVYEITADDVGPSLRNASAKVRKTERQQTAAGRPHAGPQSDPWDSGPAAADPWADDEPPF